MEAMDPAVSAAAAPAAVSGLKKQPKVRKAAKNLTPDERGKGSEKRADRRVAVRNRQNVARLEEEHRQETEWFLAAQTWRSAASLHCLHRLPSAAPFRRARPHRHRAVALLRSSPTRLSRMLLRWAPMAGVASRSPGLATSAPRRGRQGQASTSIAHRR
jgi:hypothetical protein